MNISFVAMIFETDENKSLMPFFLSFVPNNLIGENLQELNRNLFNLVSS